MHQCFAAFSLKIVTMKISQAQSLLEYTVWTVNSKSLPIKFSINRRDYRLHIKGSMTLLIKIYYSYLNKIVHNEFYYLCISENIFSTQSRSKKASLNISIVQEGLRQYIFATYFEHLHLIFELSLQFIHIKMTLSPTVKNSYFRVCIGILPLAIY